MKKQLNQPMKRSFKLRDDRSSAGKAIFFALRNLPAAFARSG